MGKTGCLTSACVLRTSVYNQGVQASYEIFDHTADMGLRVHAATMLELIAPAISGLYEMIGELAVDPRQPAKPWVHRHDREENPALKLRDFLDALLFLFEREHRVVLNPVVVEFSPTLLEVRGDAQAIDLNRTVYYREVKAITYHELSIRPHLAGFEATVIVDI